TVELYAVWAANTFTIVYHSNLDDATGSMSNQVCTYDQTTTLKANAFTRTGYNFLGWATSSDGEVEFYDSSDITNLTSTNGQTIHLYAVWEIVRCQVTFIVDGEVFVVVSVDYGTPSDEVVGKAVNGALYTVRGKLPNV
ncbi:MAG: InlB B-repeat-containing protein, partial [Candidatus Fimimonas sp.]